MLRAPAPHPLLALALASLAAGCASEAPTTSDAWSTTDTAAPFVLDTASLLTPGPERLDLITPEGVPGTRTAGPPEPTTNGQLAWSVSLESEGQTIRTLTLQRGPDESTALVTLAEPGAGRTLSFDPPLLMMPAQLTAGQIVEDEATATETDDSGRVQRTGRATVRIEPAPVPEFAESASHAIRRTLQIRLGPALIERQTTIAIAPPDTWMGERSTRTVKVFGLTVDRDEETWLPLLIDQ